CILQNSYSDESNYNSAVSSSSSSPSCETESEPLNALSNSSSSEMLCPTPQSTYAGGISFWKFSGIIPMGDFNLPHAEWNEFGARVLDVQSACYHVGRAISDSSLVQMVKEETFFCNDQPTSLLDLVLVSDPNRVSDVKRGPPLDGNASRYHCSLSFQLHSKAARPQSFDSRALHWRSGDFAAMNQFFKNHDWWRISEKGSVKDLYSDFLHIFREAAKSFVKRRRIRTLNTKPPWWNPEIASLVRQKRRNFIRKCIDNHCEQLASKHRDLCKRVKYNVKRAIIDYEIKLAQASKSNPKLIYSYMNRHYSSRECIAALMDVNNQIITDKEGICDRLNSFFFSVFEQPTLREVVKTAESNFQVRGKPDPCFVIEDVVTSDMKCVVMHFGANNRRHDYKLGGHTLAKTTRERDLGIIITSDLKSSEQAKRAAARATMAIERQLIRNSGVRHNFFINRTAGNWNTLDAVTKSVSNTNIFKKESTSY
ncbi:RNA-directed DNA polymerase from mobile element jockey-like, partial [Brachionus plicatilis]